jgi:hypothetical protein
VLASEAGFVVVLALRGDIDFAAVELAESGATLALVAGVHAAALPSAPATFDTLPDALDWFA